MSANKKEEIARLNDQFRRADNEDIKGTFHVTSGLLEHAINAGSSPLHVFVSVGMYQDFSEENDPYGERDFGVFDFEGERCYWKIDYFSDDSMTYGANDPADLTQCYRVLTIMLAAEY